MGKQSGEQQTITYKDLTLDLEGYRVYIKQENIDLTPREFEILRELIMHQGRILTRQNLLQTLWKYEFFGEERIIDTHPRRVLTYDMIIDLVWHENLDYYSRRAINNHVSNLRHKLKITPETPDYIRSVHSIGYRLNPDIKLL